MLFLIVLTTACSKESATTSLELTGYNHMVKGISRYSASVDGRTGAEAGYLHPGEGGGGFTCCISVPSLWRPGMTVIVSMTQVENGKDKTVTHVVSVPMYDATDARTLSVHFLYSGDVKVFVTKYTLGHRAYPLKGKEAELEPGVPLEIIWE
jgi:hypothetical protein